VQHNYLQTLQFHNNINNANIQYHLLPRIIRSWYK